MGLLRSCADAVLIGAGTLHGSPHTHWTAEHAYPPAADFYAQLRRRRNLAAQPMLAVVTGSGRIDLQHPGLTERSIIFTSEQGATLLRGRLPSSATVVTIGDGMSLDAAAAVRALQAAGNEIILCEGGPTLFGALVGASLIDELFLTVSPQLAGRAADKPRLALIENAALLPDRVTACRLLSARRAGSYLFLHYDFENKRKRA